MENNLLVQLTARDLKELIVNSINEKLSDFGSLVNDLGRTNKIAYSIAELCELLSVSRPTISKWQKEGLKSCNVCGRVFFLGAQVQEFLQKHSN